MRISARLSKLEADGRSRTETELFFIFSCTATILVQTNIKRRESGVLPITNTKYKHPQFSLKNGGDIATITMILLFLYNVQVWNFFMRFFMPVLTAMFTTITYRRSPRRGNLGEMCHLDVVVGAISTCPHNIHVCSTRIPCGVLSYLSWNQQLRSRATSNCAQTRYMGQDMVDHTLAHQITYTKASTHAHIWKIKRNKKDKNELSWNMAYVSKKDHFRRIDISGFPSVVLESQNKFLGDSNSTAAIQVYLNKGFSDFKECLDHAL